jgi:hypothetical protein
MPSHIFHLNAEVISLGNTIQMYKWLSHATNRLMPTLCGALPSPAYTRGILPAAPHFDQSSSAHGLITSAVRGNYVVVSWHRLQNQSSLWESEKTLTASALTENDFLVYFGAWWFWRPKFHTVAVKPGLVKSRWRGRLLYLYHVCALNKNAIPVTQQ